MSELLSVNEAFGNYDSEISTFPLFSLLMLSVAAAAPLFSRQMYIGMTVQGACGMFAGISALGCLLPFVFYSKGAELRKRSKFAI